jgi:hypothetical protein
VSPPQHAALTADRWSQFTRDQQILMIANEMNRASHRFDEDDRQGLRNCYERVLRLVDLTIAVQPKPTFRRELLRWRDLVAALFAAPEPDRPAHEEAFRVLLRFTPAASEQIAYVLPPREADGAP